MPPFRWGGAAVQTARKPIVAAVEQDNNGVGLFSTSAAVHKVLQGQECRDREERLRSLLVRTIKKDFEDHAR